MRILNIDTEILRSSVSVAEKTNEAISKAASLLNAITDHDDWICRERKEIKQMTLSNKQTANDIENHTSTFYTAVKTTSERFDESEQEMNTRINGVDDVISKISTVVPKISEVAWGSSGTGGDVDIVSVEGIASSMEG